MEKRRAVYAGSFDPPTNGHEWVIAQACAMFDLTVAVADNPDKRTRFSTRERLAMLRGIWPGKLETIGNEFLAQWALDNSFHILIRGVRNAADFEYESAMSSINADIAPVSTVLLVPPRELREVSSSMVMSLVGIDGWVDIVDKYVPASVMKVLKTAKGLE